MRHLALAAVAAFFMPVAVAKQIALVQVVDETTAVHLGVRDIPLMGDELRPFIEMSDCKAYFRWDAVKKAPWVLDDHGKPVYHAAILSCIGTEGAQHSTLIVFERPEGA